MRVLKMLVVLMALMGPAFGWSQNYPESERTGVIQKIELDTSSLIISGYRYRVPLDAHIEINGTFGAVQLLQSGMKVHFTCLVISGSEREIVWLETLPEGTPIEEA